MLREKEKKQRVAEKNGHALPDKAHYGLNGYRPSDKEPFMNERQRDYFRAKLQMWKDEILKEARRSEKRLLLFGLSIAVREVLQLTRLTGVFEIRETEGQVLEA